MEQISVGIATNITVLRNLRYHSNAKKKRYEKLDDLRSTLNSWSFQWKDRPSRHIEV